MEITHRHCKYHRIILRYGCNCCGFFLARGGGSVYIYVARCKGISTHTGANNAGIAKPKQHSELGPRICSEKVHWNCRVPRTVSQTFAAIRVAAVKNQGPRFDKFPLVACNSGHWNHWTIPCLCTWLHAAPTNKKWACMVGALQTNRETRWDMYMSRLHSSGPGKQQAPFCLPKWVLECIIYGASSSESYKRKQPTGLYVQL